MPYQKLMAALAFLPLLLVGSVNGQDATKTAEVKADKKVAWKSLLPKSGLKGWEITDFGSSGKVTNKDGVLSLEMGDPLNGINYLGKDFPKNDYEIVLKANRTDGNDFLCGLTFPVGKEFCSFIAGGWGGSIVGLSSIDGFDASENSTSTYLEFENDKWYEFRIRVDDEFITAWVDDEKIFYQDREGHEFSTRIEVYASQPLGFCAFQSAVEVKDFKWRSLKEPAKKTADKQKEAQSKSAAPLKGTIE